MKKLWVVVTWVLIVGCQSAEELDPPMISAVPEQIHLGQRAVGEGPYQFDIQLRNIGQERLTISGARISGDQNCAFHFMGPDIKEVLRKQAAFVRVWYDPLDRGFDQVLLRVSSNSEEHGTLSIPICGEAVLPEQITDAGVDDAPEVCTPPPSDQPDCEEK